jgi:membrane protein DedA with SNARE-associated domain
LSFLPGINGTIAVVLFCGLLFAEDAGVPLPFAPGELVLLAAGLLIATGGLSPYVFVPLALLACTGGALLGFTWAGIVGNHGLEAIARRIHGVRTLQQVRVRVHAAGPLGIAITRLIPGLRIYTTLAAGALNIRRRTFLFGVVLATMVWVAVFITLGGLIGVPLEHAFNQVSQIALQGVILVVVAIGAYVTVRRAPPAIHGGIIRLQQPLRTGLAAILDACIVASVVVGLIAAARPLFGAGFASQWFDIALPMLVTVILYVVIVRRSAGGTVGEALLNISYRRRRRSIDKPSIN